VATLSPGKSPQSGSQNHHSRGDQTLECGDDSLFTGFGSKVVALTLSFGPGDGGSDFQFGD